MAVIEQRGPAQWRAKVRKGGISSSKTFIYKADAEDWARETEAAIQRGAWKDMRPAQQPFQELAKSYLEEVTPKKKSGDREAYRIAVLMAAPEFQRPIGSIQPAHVAAYRARRETCPAHAARTRAIAQAAAKDAEAKAKNQTRNGAAQRVKTAARLKGTPTKFLSPQTIRHELNTLSAIFEYARFERSVPLGDNPVRAIRLPKLGEPRNRRLAPLEHEYLQKAAHGVYSLPQAITVALETSMRLGEMLSLTWRNIDLIGKVAHLPMTKNGRARDVALSPAALAALRELRPFQPASVDSKTHGPALLAALAAARKEGRVFHWAASDSFDKSWRRALTRARAAYQADQIAVGVEADPMFLADLRWHDLRHEAISRLFERGLNIFEVASMSGHKSLHMLGRYTHMEAKRTAVKLDQEQSQAIS